MEEQEKIPGPLLLQIDLNKTDMPDDMIINFYHNGMIDFMEFTYTEKIENLMNKFGEKFLIIAGNISYSALNPKVYSKILASFPEATAYTYRPARKRIYLTDREYAGKYLKTLFMKEEPDNFSFQHAQEQIKIFQRSENIPKFESWKNYRLAAEGHYLQIWVTPNWKMILPFSGEGDSLTDEENAIINTDKEDNPMFEDSQSYGSIDTIPDTHRDF